MAAERSTGDAATDIKATAAAAAVDDATAGITAALESNALKAEEQQGREHESDTDEDNQFEDALEQEEETDGDNNNNSEEEEHELKAPPATEQSDAIASVTAHQSVQEEVAASTPSDDQVVISRKASDSTDSTAPISSNKEEATKQSVKKSSPTTAVTKEELAPRQVPVPRHEQSQQQRPATARSAISKKPFVPLPPSKNWRTMALRSNGQLSRIMQAALLKTLLHAIRRGSAEGVKVAIERGVSLQYIDSRSRNLIMYVDELE